MGNVLFSTTNFIQVPIVKVVIGKYEFGVYNKSSDGNVKFPDYINSLNVTKINGRVNQYTLNIIYQINQNRDPNFFEKVFSSVSSTREISFTYGDASIPNFLYKNEQAVITKVTSNFDLENARISYTVNAVSKAGFGLSGSYNFGQWQSKKPSEVIRSILQNPLYGLQEIFTGMRNMNLVNTYGLIPNNDEPKTIMYKENTNILDYLQYLVDLMTPASDKASEKKSIYVLTFVDDTSGVFNGTYFKILQVNQDIKHADAYQLDIGYPSSNYVYNFSVENNESYALLYSYEENLHPKKYVTRLTADGDYEDVYAPVSTSGNDLHETTESDKAWWAKVTNYPIKATVTIKGLLRPALLMTYIRLNLILFGQKHINSGLYIVTKQEDVIDGSGYRTTLNLTRVGEDE